MSFQWYALQVYSGSEQSVKKAIYILATDNSLEDKIENIIVPTEDIIEIKNGKKKITERSLYPGYVFVHIDLTNELWHKIQSLPRVSRFIGEKKSVTPLSQEDIKLIIEKKEQKADPKPKISFDNGESVRIIDGAFANFVATVEDYDFIHGKLRLNVSIFGRNTPVEILYTQVEKII